MTGFFRDRYFLFSIVVAVIIMVSFSINPNEDNGIVGIAFDVKEGQNGYTFTLEDTNGNSIRCFTKDVPYENHLYKIKGTFSDDNTILFISSISPLN